MSTSTKRPHPGDGDLADGNKRPRSNNASPAPPSKPDIAKQIAEARARAAALVAARAPQAQSAPQPAAQSPAEAARAKIEAMKARVAAATAKAQAPAQQRTASPMPAYQPPEFDEGLTRARGGLGIGLHPALMGDVGQAGAKGKQAIQPKFATTMANRRAESPVQRPGKEKKQLDLSAPSLEELRKDPNYDANLAAQSGLRNRHSRQLVFNQKGKYIAQASALRRQAALEAMKRRIAEQAKKVGLDEDNEKAFLVPAPPDIEWWDENLVDGKDYSVVEDPGKIKIDTADSIITRYIQHPVLLEPPQEKNMPPPKPMFLTKTEQAKKRRQERNANHKDEQMKIRLGLVPPPPPKVKKSNLMRVLGEQAVKDPTAVEARVNREIAERAAKHQEENEARQLTHEQKLEKLARNQEADAAKGIQVCVFKIDNLSFKKHRSKIDMNAKQLALTGITILHPRMNLVIVEGGPHAVKFYKKLMLNRIDWTENAMPSSVREGNKEAEAEFLQATDEKGELKDLSQNKCQLVWEGEERARAFRRWGSRVCETDTDAKDALSRSKMENMWTLAKSMK
ncbi:U4/U5/U6 small nuclear ribonucleoprotein prp3 [Coniosporium apollinis]|uniref:U4/U5/U6 small nuclear ribonucleoprotein prp3 n=2 Tax=Coniosporium TaxID=2810619 RepID=A0ABQ9P008_9PEZI|nr:U4/U5/U6 small nuclear ribonucleoprotein prp3 [Cladosporium sp. JES 115]KAJ9667929.1 U4/U5/U6 small nuclear ribonucleoprotein prp3 [Coniosporium apollinis]